MKEFLEKHLVVLVADYGKKSLLVTTGKKLGSLEKEMLQVHPELSPVEKLVLKLDEMSDEERVLIKQVYDIDTRIKSIKAYTKRNLNSPKKVYRKRDYM